MTRATSISDVRLSKHVSISYNALYNKKLYDTHNAKICAIVLGRMLELVYETKILTIPEDIQITVKPIKSKTTFGLYHPFQRQVTIDFRRKDLNLCVQTLMHELVHAEQWFTGKQKMTPKGIVWNGQIVSNKGTTYKKYREQPWEKEAFDREYDLAYKIITLYNQEYAKGRWERGQI